MRPPVHVFLKSMRAATSLDFAVGATSSREQDLLIPVLDQQISRLIDCAMKPLVGQRLIIYNLFGLLASRDFGIRVLQVWPLMRRRRSKADC